MMERNSHDPHHIFFEDKCYRLVEYRILIASSTYHVNRIENKYSGSFDFNLGLISKFDNFSKSKAPQQMPTDNSFWIHIAHVHVLIHESAFDIACGSCRQSDPGEYFELAVSSHTKVGA